MPILQKSDTEQRQEMPTLRRMVARTATDDQIFRQRSDKTDRVLPVMQHQKQEMGQKLYSMRLAVGLICLLITAQAEAEP